MLATAGLFDIAGCNGGNETVGATFFEAMKECP
jgi:hypothetical protein